MLYQCSRSPFIETYVAMSDCRFPSNILLHLPQEDSTGSGMLKQLKYCFIAVIKFETQFETQFETILF